MKRVFKALAGMSACAIVLGVLLNLSGCKPEESPSLYDPNWKSLPQPVVESITPSGVALAGIDTIRIYGKNFSANKDSDGVYFGAYLVRGPLFISASTTELVFLAPAVSGDSLQVRVYVLGAIDFSPTVLYGLQAAISPFSTFAQGEGAYGLTMGADSILYASISNSGATQKDEGIFQISSAGVRSASPYVLPTPGNVSWLYTRFGPDGIYATKASRALYRLTQGGNGATAWTGAASGTFSDLDFDQSHYLWVGWNGSVGGVPTSSIYRVTLADKSTRIFPAPGVVKAVRVFGTDLYFSANVAGGKSKIYKAPIVSDTLGTPTEVFDLANDPTGGNNVYTMAFSADGDIYAGVDSSDYLIVVHPGGSFERPYAGYVSTGVLSSPVKSISWVGMNLYASTASGGLLLILPRKQSAPYYGIQ